VLYWPGMAMPSETWQTLVYKSVISLATDRNVQLHNIFQKRIRSYHRQGLPFNPDDVDHAQSIVMYLLMMVTESGDA
jgi:hypothetical protein